jgi:lysophospholipid acyltransferase (LPLAT)-like uncharacterized protein
MSLVKKLLSSAKMRACAGYLISGYVRVTAAFTRFVHIRSDIPQGFWQANRAFILAFWHGQMLFMPLCWNSRQAMHMLISQHRDGDLIARSITHFGLCSIRGSAAAPHKSKDKGGAAALRAMLRALKKGQSVGITPDGPRGPRMRAGDGIVTVARLSAAPILPVACATSRRHLLPSWDRFAIGFPFGRGAIVWGEPIYVDRRAGDTEIEAARQRVEFALNRLSDEAHALVGHPPMMPAPDRPSPREAAPHER